MSILVATERNVIVIDVEQGTRSPARGLADRPTCLIADPLVQGRAWCGTHKGGLFRSDDGGGSWQAVGLRDRMIMTVIASPVERDVVWVGTEPSEVWRSEKAGTLVFGMVLSAKARYAPRPLDRVPPNRVEAALGRDRGRRARVH